MPSSIGALADSFAAAMSSSNLKAVYFGEEEIIVYSDKVC